jgi:hypothetical protein
MLALLAAAALGAAPVQAQPLARPDGPVAYVLREVKPGVCNGVAGRMQTAYEPALLLRPQDRAAAVAQKLKDLPPAVSCLVGLR